MIVYFGKIFGVYDCRPFKFKGAFIKIFGAPAEDGNGWREYNSLRLPSDIGIYPPSKMYIASPFVGVKAEKRRLTARKHGGMIKLNYKKLHAIYAGRRDKIWVEGEPALPIFN